MLERAGERRRIHAVAAHRDSEAVAEKDRHLAALCAPVVAFVDELTVDLGRALVARSTEAPAATGVLGSAILWPTNDVARHQTVVVGRHFLRAVPAGYFRQ